MQNKGTGKNGNKPVLLVVLIIVVGSLAIFWKSSVKEKETKADTQTTKESSSAETVAALRKSRLMRSEAKGNAEEQIAARLKEFTQKRRELAARYAEKLGIALPPEVGAFFDSAEAGDFEALQKLWSQMDFNNPAMQSMRPLLLETFGVHEQVSKWPPQELLDYGASILANVSPGSIYLGGTDAGRFIPTLLNETGSSPNHIVLTQNAFADSSYIDYVNFLYADRFVPLAAKDSQEAFGKYLGDAKRRLEHDQNFPNEPKQLREGENISMTEGRVQVSGAGAVMAINESLLKMLRVANPDLSIAMEESLFAMPSFYEGATTKGPLIFLDAQGNQAITSETADTTMAVWKETAGRLLEKPDLLAQEAVAKAYAQLLIGHGNLFQSQQLYAQAEEAFRLAMQINPNDARAVQQLSSLKALMGRR